MKPSLASALAILFLSAGGCGPSDDPGGSGDEGGDAGDDLGAAPDARSGSDNGEFVDAAPAESCDKMDLVFIVDDSISMAQEQRTLAANFPRFIEVLDGFQTPAGDLLDYRVAVTTTGRSFARRLRTSGGTFPNGTTNGADGAFQQDCGMSRRWLERGEPNLTETFSCIANVGVRGPTDEMPLASTRDALDTRVADGTNDGFLRDDALLAIVILTDEDDCSVPGDEFTIDDQTPAGDQGACVPGRPVELIDVSDTITFLDALKGAPGRWAAAVIAGPGPDTCSSVYGDALPANRLLDFVAQKAPNASFSSLCEGDLTRGLADALATFDAACRSFPPVE